MGNGPGRAEFIECVWIREQYTGSTVREELETNNHRGKVVRKFDTRNLIL